MTQSKPSALTFPDEQNIENLRGFIKTVTTAPTYTPRTLSQQIVIAVVGGVSSLYVYDTINQAWKATTLTTV